MAGRLFFGVWGILGAVSGLGSAQAAEQHTKDTLKEIHQRLDDHEAVMLDVREQAEWDDGHLAEAELLPLSELKNAASDPALADKIKKLVGDKKIVYCHCRAGRRALTAAEILRKLGYDVRPLKQGYQELIEAGFPKAE